MAATVSTTTAGVVHAVTSALSTLFWPTGERLWSAKTTTRTCSGPRVVRARDSAVATRFHVALRPLPRALTLSSFVFPLEEAATAWKLVDDLSANLAREAGLAVGITTAPHGTLNAGKVVASIIGIAFAETSDQGASFLAPLNGDPRVRIALSAEVNVASDLNGLHGAIGAPLFWGASLCRRQHLVQPATGDGTGGHGRALRKGTLCGLEHHGAVLPPGFCA